MQVCSKHLVASWLDLSMAAAGNSALILFCCA